jgi:hypothetical protein
MNATIKICNVFLLLDVGRIAVRLSVRYTITLVLTMMYMAITISPLAPLALRSKVIAHAVTGECSGDCDICGCSPERRANHTCCCWQKKLQQKQKKEHDKHANHVADCCKKKQTSKTIMTCGCPCGNGKTVAFSGAAKLELLPYHYAEDIDPSPEDSKYHVFYRRLTTRHGESPDPPPKISLIS